MQGTLQARVRKNPLLLYLAEEGDQYYRGRLQTESNARPTLNRTFGLGRVKGYKD